jgi:hypothetical protein
VRESANKRQLRNWFWDSGAILTGGVLDSAYDAYWRFSK